MAAAVAWHYDENQWRKKSVMAAATYRGGSSIMAKWRGGSGGSRRRHQRGISARGAMAYIVA